ncbi:MAG: hypothetical protein SV775_12725 [Thermodesulfobacteriota bacterium]|nr:hypothetical protein [Thermodesulfobacteriota bacterium]
MKCRKVKSLLLDFFEGELKEDTKKMLANHLVACTRCSDELKTIEKTLEALKSSGLKDPGEDFWDEFLLNVKKELSSQKPVRAKYRLFLWPKGATANLTSILFAEKVRYVSIGAIASVLLICLICLKLAFDPSEPRTQFKFAGRNLEEVILKEGYPPELIEDVLASSENAFLFSGGEIKKTSSLEIKELYSALSILVSRTEPLEDICYTTCGLLNGDKIFWEIEDLGMQEIEFVFEELRLRYPLT